VVGGSETHSNKPVYWSGGSGLALNPHSVPLPGPGGFRKMIGWDFGDLGLWSLDSSFFWTILRSLLRKGFVAVHCVSWVSSFCFLRSFDLRGAPTVQWESLPFDRNLRLRAALGIWTELTSILFRWQRRPLCGLAEKGETAHFITWNHTYYILYNFII
jgi:hypothetical protein